LTLTWSGPSGTTFSDVHAANPSVIFSASGTYLLRLTATTAGAACACSTYSEVTITVCGPNQPPTIGLPSPALNYTVGDPATVIDSTATVEDVDTPNFATGILAVDFLANGIGDDR